MQKYPDGASFGDIARIIGIVGINDVQSSTPLGKSLSVAIVVGKRNVFYAIDTTGSSGLVSFLAEDSLRSHPERIHFCSFLDASNSVDRNRL